MNKKSIGILFDIDGLGAPMSYGSPCWRILMKYLDLSKMPGVLFYQGDLDIEASERSYCFCIAISELEMMSGGQGLKHFIQMLSSASDAGLFPLEKRFVEGSITDFLVPSGRVDMGGRFMMSRNLGELGDLELVSNGRKLGWTIVPDDDLLAIFAHSYLRKTNEESILPLRGNSKELCESVLRDVGEHSTIAALRAAGLPPEDLDIARQRLEQQVWKKSSQEQQAESALSGSRAKRWWQFWKNESALVSDQVETEALKSIKSNWDGF
jgi:hypothetical protein